MTVENKGGQDSWHCAGGAGGVVAVKEADILCGCCLRAQLRFKRTRIQLRTSKTHGRHQLVVWFSKSSVRVVSSQHFSRNTRETNEVLFRGDRRMTEYDFLKCPIRQAGMIVADRIIRLFPCLEYKRSRAIMVEKQGSRE